MVLFILSVNPRPWYFLKVTLREKPKGAEQILRERGLWLENGKRSNGHRFHLNLEDVVLGGQAAK
jgi:hypothetical protein